MKVVIMAIMIHNDKYLLIKFAITIFCLIRLLPSAYAQCDSTIHTNIEQTIPLLDIIDIDAVKHYPHNLFISAHSNEISFGFTRMSDDNIFRINTLSITAILKDEYNSNNGTGSVFAAYQLAALGLQALLFSPEGLFELGMGIKWPHNSVSRNIVLFMVSPVMLANSELHMKIFGADSIASRSIRTNLFLRAKTDRFIRGEGRWRFSPELGSEVSLPLGNETLKRIGFQVAVRRQIDYINSSKVLWLTKFSFSVNIQYP